MGSDPIQEVRLGRAEDELRKLRGADASMIFTDPPYSSGGLFRDDRAGDPSEKYQHHGQQLKRATFTGDNKDQRAFTSWQAHWMTLAAATLRPGGYFLCWTDWRQLPSTADAFQWAGLIWRGLLVWDKGLASRAPHKGYYRHQAEYVVWGTLGRCAKLDHDGPFPGVVNYYQPPSEKRHMTAKPVAVLDQWLRPLKPGDLLVDPFCGSASLGVAAKRRQLSYQGIEVDPSYVAEGRKWIQEEGGLL